jgi:hypothetical protein
MNLRELKLSDVIEERIGGRVHSLCLGAKVTNHNYVLLRNL